MRLLIGFWCLCTIAGFAQPVHTSGVSGIFYPGTRDSLINAIAEYSRIAKPSPPFHAPPIGVIAPHAGYAYSGPVAASAYRAVEQGRYKTVVILGPSHFIAFDGVAITPAGSWETPVGRVAIDEKRARHIMKRCPFIHDSAALFAREHSIETQIPFVQRTFPKARIVPLEMGTMTGEHFSLLAEALAEFEEDTPGEVLIVASSDLSHYHTDSQARHIDNVTLTDILSGDLGRVVADLNSHASEMCGFAPVITMMLAAERLGAQSALLAYATTANATGDTSRVVGYSALAFTISPSIASFANEEKKALLSIARRAVDAAAHHAPSPDTINMIAALNVKGGLFVTLAKNGVLRGCIGSMRATEPLWKAAADMGNNAACRDPRFAPVTVEELPDLSIEISILSPMQRIRSIDSIHVGIHGLYLVKENFSGVLLPQVATDNHWDRAEFLRQLCIKAGVHENAWKDSDAKLYSFTVEVVK